jgi:hypothetical protein
MRMKSSALRRPARTGIIDEVTMASPSELPRMVSIGTCATLAVALGVLSHAKTADTIEVWKIGSPYKGDTPRPGVPSGLQQASTRLGFRIAVEAFPAKGFAPMFLDAVRRNAAPDILVFDNMGVMQGITTALGSFEGIGQEATTRRDLIHVTGAFDDLLGPARGWTYLFSSSPNHKAARTLALRTPECPGGSSGPNLQGELIALVPKLASAYLEGDAISIQTYSDPDRLATIRSKPQTASVGTVQPCGIWGNSRVAFASLNVSYDAETTVGHTRVLIVLRKQSSRWQLLAVARDPVTNGPFVKELPSMIAGLRSNDQPPALPAPATLLSPATGHWPGPSTGQGFGLFTWRSSPSEDVVAEVAEFAYQDDARLFVSRPARPGSGPRISAGQLWTTGGEWNWRVWSLTGTGDIVFSDVRTFQH